MNYEEKLKEIIDKVVEELQQAIESDDSNVVTDTKLWARQVLSQSLSNYKKELVEEIEKLDRPSHIDDTEGYYDLAIEDILSLLQKDKEISK